MTSHSLASSNDGGAALPPKASRSGEFLSDLKAATATWRRAPSLVAITLVIGVAQTLQVELGARAAKQLDDCASGGVLSECGVPGLPFLGLSVLAVSVFSIGWAGTQRVWYLRLFRGEALSGRDVWRFTWRFFPRYLALGSIGVVGAWVLAANIGTSHLATATGRVALYCLFLGVEIVATFVVPALAFSTASVADAIAMGLRMMRATWPRSAWYVMTPALAALLIRTDRVRSHAGLTFTVPIAGVLGLLLALAFRGATAAFYLRLVSPVGRNGAALIRAPRRCPQGHAVGSIDRFCQECGARLESDVAVGGTYQLPARVHRVLPFRPQWARVHPLRWGVLFGLVTGSLDLGLFRHVLRWSVRASLIAAGVGCAWSLVAGLASIKRETPEKEERVRARLERLPAALNPFRWPSWFLGALLLTAFFAALGFAGNAIRNGDTLQALWIAEAGAVLVGIYYYAFDWARGVEASRASEVSEVVQVFPRRIQEIVIWEEMPASLTRRVLARIVDLVIVFIFVSVLASPFIQNASDGLAGTIVILGFALVGSMYEIALVRWRAATLGKSALGLRIVSTRNRRRFALSRWAWGLGILVIPVLDIVALLMAVLDRPRHRALYDRASGTLVVHRRKGRRPAAASDDPRSFPADG